MEIASIWPVLKWVLVVLIAGFIAQFGKAMAQAIMKKMGKKKAAAPSPAMLPASAPSSSLGEPEAADRQASGTLVHKTTSPPSVADKKLIKAALKQQKKAAKNK